MPGTNDFKAWAIGPSTPNTLTAAVYVALFGSGLVGQTGFQSGVADSATMNTVWRQSSTMAAVLGQIIANSGVNAQDSAGAGTVATLVSQLLTALNALLPRPGTTGVIELWAGNSAVPPTGSVFCRGQSLDRTTFAALFAVIGVTYGSVDSTHFTMPDTRGVFVRGQDASRGIDPSRALGSFQNDTTRIPRNVTAQHLSPELGVTALVNGTNPSTIGFARAAKSGENVTVGGTDASEGTYGELDCLNVVTGDDETRPVNIALNYIIWT